MLFALTGLTRLSKVHLTIIRAALILQTRVYPPTSTHLTLD